jgi:hypothetical protein
VRTEQQARVLPLNPTNLGVDLPEIQNSYDQ